MKHHTSYQNFEEEIVNAEQFRVGRKAPVFAKQFIRKDTHTPVITKQEQDEQTFPDMQVTFADL